MAMRSMLFVILNAKMQRHHRWLCRQGASSSFCIFALRAFFLVMVLASCHNHPFYDFPPSEAGTLRIEFDWNGYTDIPPGMNIMFYPVAQADGYSGDPIFMQLQYYGGEVSLPVGKYDVVFYNDYTYNILYRGMETYRTAEAYLDEYNRLPLSSRSGGTRNVMEPDIFYVTQIESLEVRPDDRNRTITVYPKLVTLQLFIHVTIDGMQYVSMADGCVNGGAGSVMLATGMSPDDTPNSRIFPFSITDAGLYAETRMFLNRSYMTSPYTLELAFLLRNNSVSMSEKYKFDISDQIIPMLESNGGRIPPEGIHIYINGVVVDEVASGDGFNAVIDGWGDEVNIELE